MSIVEIIYTVKRNILRKGTGKCPGAVEETAFSFDLQDEVSKKERSYSLK